MSINKPRVLRLLDNNSEEQGADPEFYKQELAKVTHELRKLRKKFNLDEGSGDAAPEKENESPAAGPSEEKVNRKKEIRQG